MIYESVDVAEPIRQGDIFRSVPRVDISLKTLAVLDENAEHRETSWSDIISINGGEGVVAALPVKPVLGIVVTQNCDAARGRYLSLSQIDRFLEVTGQSEPKNAKAWQSLITKQSRQHLRFFYLPTDESIGFTERMAVDFRVIMPMPRADLEDLREHRIGRLNVEAYEHFRETLAQFLRRYPYDEWYPLNRSEFQAYAQSKQEEISPRNWQILSETKSEPTP